MNKVWYTLTIGEAASVRGQAMSVGALGSDLRPPLKWLGGKRWLVRRLQTIWTRHADRQLVEPFVGGMAVALGLQPGAALLNDVNPHLINFYRQIQRGLVIDFELKNDRTFYYERRARFNTLISLGKINTAEAAALFYYLNRTGYNGLCRFNRKGFYNVPFGRYRTINYIYDFSAYAGLLASWRVSAGDFVVTKPDSEAFIYADPPYDRGFTGYHAGGFTWEEQVRLARWLAQHPGPVVASNLATGRMVALYSSLGFQIEIVHAPRRISCTGDRSPAPEMIATRGV